MQQINESVAICSTTKGIFYNGVTYIGSLLHKINGTWRCSIYFDGEPDETPEVSRLHAAILTISTLNTGISILIYFEPYRRLMPLIQIFYSCDLLQVATTWSIVVM